MIETERLQFREFTEEDAPFMLELLNSPGFIEGVRDHGIRSVEGAAQYIRERIVASYRTNGFGLWAVAVRGEDAPIGMCGLVKREGLADADLGYAFLERAWKQGYAQEAGRAVLDYARCHLRLERIVAITSPGNVASRRVLERIGMRHAGQIELPGWDAPSAYYTTEP